MLTGWKAITKHTNLSIKTLKKLAKEHGFPVRLDTGVAISSRVDIQAWLSDWIAKGKSRRSRD